LLQLALFKHGKNILQKYAEYNEFVKKFQIKLAEFFQDFVAKYREL